jgi:hypothetical protein
MKQLALITQGHSEYDERLSELLDATGIDPHEFSGLDYFGLVPFFVLAGASVRPVAHTHGPEVHVEMVYVEVADELQEPFYATLEAILDDAYSDADPE